MCLAREETYHPNSNGKRRDNADICIQMCVTASFKNEKISMQLRGDHDTRAASAQTWLHLAAL
jgi:hypothetical protein